MLLLVRKSYHDLQVCLQWHSSRGSVGKFRERLGLRSCGDTWVGVVRRSFWRGLRCRKSWRKIRKLVEKFSTAGLQMIQVLEQATLPLSFAFVCSVLFILSTTRTGGLLQVSTCFCGWVLLSGGPGLRVSGSGSFCFCFSLGLVFSGVVSVCGLSILVEVVVASTFNLVINY